MPIGPQGGSSGKVLVIEDSASISDVVATALGFHGYSVTKCDDGREGLDTALSLEFDLIVLDVMLPGLGGFEVCRRLRDRGRSTPVLFLTARDEADNRIKGFTSGADDYLTKPFSVDELVLRVDAILRRAGAAGMVGPSTVVEVADLRLDPAGQTVERAGAPIELTATEFRLLHYLMVNAGVVLSKAQVLVSVWDDGYEGSENVVELYIGYLRRKVDDGHSPLIHTKRGAGYVLREQV